MAYPCSILPCVTCGCRTRHTFDLEPVAPGNVFRYYCEECGTAVDLGPADDEYCVTITNITGPPVEPAAGQYTFVWRVQADSKAEALDKGVDQAMHWARGVNSRGGIHGAPIREEALRSQATVVPAKDADPRG